MCVAVEHPSNCISSICVKLMNSLQGSISGAAAVLSSVESSYISSWHRCRVVISCGDASRAALHSDLQNSNSKGQDIVKMQD
jgi:hypothetical protein